MNVGWIGLGAMGAAMARNLLGGGDTLRVWNRDASKTGPLTAQGATAVEKPVDLSDCDVVFAMLANDAATRETVLDSGLVDALAKTATFVNCATISISFANDLATRFREAGVAYVAAPVLGRPDAAAAAKLNIIAAGDDAAIARVQPLLDRIGQKTYRAGREAASANAIKIGANFLIASAIESLGEAFAIAKTNDVDPALLHEIVTGTIFAGSPVYKNYGTQIIQECFEPGFALALGLKDVGLALQAGEAAGIALPVAQTLSVAFARAVDAGDGDKDWTAVTRRLR